MKYNYHPIDGEPSPTAKTSREYHAEIYGDTIACRTVRAAEACYGPLKARVSESLYREYFRRAYAELLRKA